MQHSSFLDWILMQSLSVSLSFRNSLFACAPDPVFSLSPPSTPLCLLVYPCCSSIPVTLKAAMPCEEGQLCTGLHCSSAFQLLQTLNICRLTETANHQQSCAFMLCLLILLNEHPKTCLEMLNNCCNYPVFLKSFFICVTLPTNIFHLRRKQHRYK